MYTKRLLFYNDLIDYIMNEPVLSQTYNFTHKFQEYCIEDIIPALFHILRTGEQWDTFKQNIDILKRQKIINNVSDKYIPKNYTPKKVILGKSLHYHFQKLCKHNIFEKFYIHILNKYMSNNKYDNLKYNNTDTSFVSNKLGCNNIGINKFYKSKYGNKVSIISDSNNIPISITVHDGNDANNKIFMKTLNSIYISTNTEKLKKSNRYKQYMFADKGYDTDEIRTELNNRGYTPIIDYNARNTKDETKLKKLTAKEKEKYKKRLGVEHIFAKIKGHNRRLGYRYERNIISFSGFIFMAFIKLISVKVYAPPKNK
jgi:hypothetical protein